MEFVNVITLAESKSSVTFIYRVKYEEEKHDILEA